MNVLEVPAALRIRLVISGDEFDQLLVLEQAPFGLRATTAKRATGLCALVTHEPVAACIQPKPAVTMRHARPLGHGLLDDVIHAGNSTAQPSAAEPTGEARPRVCFPQHAWHRCGWWRVVWVSAYRKTECNRPILPPFPIDRGGHAAACICATVAS